MTTPPHCRRCSEPIPHAAPSSECPACLLELSLSQPVEPGSVSPADYQPHYQARERAARRGRQREGGGLRAGKVRGRLVHPDRLGRANGHRPLYGARAVGRHGGGGSSGRHLFARRDVLRDADGRSAQSAVQAAVGEGRHRPAARLGRVEESGRGTRRTLPTSGRDQDGRAADRKFVAHAQTAHRGPGRVGVAAPIQFAVRGRPPLAESVGLVRRAIPISHIVRRRGEWAVHRHRPRGLRRWAERVLCLGSPRRGIAEPGARSSSRRAAPANCRTR